VPRQRAAIASTAKFCSCIAPWCGACTPRTPVPSQRWGPELFPDGVRIFAGCRSRSASAPWPGLWARHSAFADRICHRALSRGAARIHVGLSVPGARAVPRRLNGAIISFLTVLVIADLTAGTGRFNLAQGAVGAMSAIAASVSTLASGIPVSSNGSAQRISRYYRDCGRSHRGVMDFCSRDKTGQVRRVNGHLASAGTGGPTAARWRSAARSCCPRPPSRLRLPTSRLAAP
jgi:hypothetical protein